MIDAGAMRKPRQGDGSSPRERRRSFAACAIAVLAALAAGMSPLRAAGADAEPRVARVAHVDGEVSYLNADAQEWTPVEVNAPLATGDRFYAGPDGRAEIQLAAGLYARVASDSEIDVLDLSSDAVQVRVGMGTALFRLRNPPAERYFEIATPGAAIVPRLRGLYRVDVDRDGRTRVLVREGEADAYRGDERYRVASGQGAEIVLEEGSSEPLEVFPASGVELDAWDDWSGSRDARVASAASYRYVSQDVYGAEDLDEYGDWDDHAEYGPIWRPTRVDSGWAPFTRGRWVWQDPWGWTWVDYEPWGWAPCHYGRWVHVNDYWAWAPGPVVPRPVYAPAVVGFVGFSTPSVSVSIGIGPSVGWVPLGYGEPVVPWWGGVGGVVVGRPWWGGWGGPRIVNQKIVNQTNITNINVTNIRYANFERRGGFTAVSHDDFRSGRMRRLDVPREHFRDVRPLRGSPGIVPARESLIAARPERVQRGRAVAPPREAIERAAVTARQPRLERPKFERKLAAIEKGQGAPVAPAELRRMAREERATEVATIPARGSRAVRPREVAAAPGRGRGGDERAQVGRAGEVEARARAGSATRESGERAALDRPDRDQGARAGGATRDNGAMGRSQRTDLAEDRAPRGRGETAGRETAAPADRVERQGQERPAQRQQLDRQARPEPEQEQRSAEPARERQQREEASQREQAAQRQQLDRQARPEQEQRNAAQARERQQREEAGQREQAAQRQQLDRQARPEQEQRNAAQARERQQREEAGQREQAAQRQQLDRQARPEQEQRNAAQARERQQREEAGQREQAAQRQQLDRQARPEQEQRNAAQARERQQREEASQREQAAQRRQRDRQEQQQRQEQQRSQMEDRARQRQDGERRQAAAREQRQQQQAARRQRDADAEARRSQQQTQDRQRQQMRAREGQQRQQAQARQEQQRQQAQQRQQREERQRRQVERSRPEAQSPQVERSSGDAREAQRDQRRKRPGRSAADTRG